MQTPFVIVVGVLPQKSPQMTLVQDDDVVDKLSSYAADHAFDVRILPRRSRCRLNASDAKALDSLPHCRSVDAVTVTKDISRRIIERKRLHELLRCPLSGGMLSYIEMDDPASVMGQNDKYKQDFKFHCWHHEKIHRRPILGMQFGKSLPAG